MEKSKRNNREVGRESSSDDAMNNAITTVFFTFVALVFGITIGLGMDNMSQFDKYSLGENISPEEERNEYNYFSEGAVRCDVCLVDALGALPENWCAEGSVMKPQPFYDSDQNCYCPSPPECIK